MKERLQNIDESMLLDIQEQEACPVWQKEASSKPCNGKRSREQTNGGPGAKSGGCCESILIKTKLIISHSNRFLPSRIDMHTNG